ncbi:hypothetical protein ACFVZD_48430 [Streptomyces sp. NPDC058287]|uniref:hypothetical protein n=1 Tax=unclassified Streptomyces TaxID=2593676 RepID=UPI0036E74F51
MDNLADFAELATPARLLPLLALEEAQDVVELLASVGTGGVLDREWARTLEMNPAARVPSRD